MPRTVLRVKPFRQILTAAEPEVMVQLVRLFILYEDLKLEMSAFHVPGTPEFDEVKRSLDKRPPINRVNPGSASSRG